VSALVKIKAGGLIKREAKPARLLDQKRQQQKITIKISEAMPSPISSKRQTFKSSQLSCEYII